MKRFYLPWFIYELLPFAYMIVGILLYFEISIVPPKAVGVILALTGLYIVKMRVDYRFSHRK